METIINSKGGWILAGLDTLAGRYLEPLLEKNIHLPDLTLFHCADSDAWPDGRGVDPDATRRLLDSCPHVKNIVYLSSFRVYNQDAGEDVDESRPLFPNDEAGRKFALTEKLLTDRAAQMHANLTIIRAARMFGSGMSGELSDLFNRVIRGHYVHVRGNEAALSAVTALNAADVMLQLAGKPGVFNLSDGNGYTWMELATAMTANCGAEKRLTVLPEKWVKWIYRLFGKVPIVAETMSPEAQESVSKTLVLDISRLREALPDFHFHHTLDVLARRADYPYAD